MSEMDKTIQLSNKIAELLNGEELDDVIPSLVMVLSHAAHSTGLPIQLIIGFVAKTLMVGCPPDDDVTKH